MKPDSTNPMSRHHLGKKQLREQNLFLHFCRSRMPVSNNTEIPVNSCIFSQSHESMVPHLPYLNAVRDFRLRSTFLTVEVGSLKRGVRHDFWAVASCIAG